MLDKLQSLKDRFEEVGQLIILPDSMSDMSAYAKLTKEYKDLEKLVGVADAYTLVLQNIDSSKEILDKEKDPEFREMAKAELDDLRQKKVELEEELKQLLTPKDPNDSKDCILEIRGGTGGDEAAIFAGDLFRMYERFCEMQNWKLTVLDLTFGSAGGYKEIIATVSGADVYGMLKYESGVHRVQRLPATESQGRVHTSAITVAVLPEAEEVDFKLDMNDVRKDTFRASGAGGQHINKTESAIRLTHIPTGVVVECQDGRSQHKNLEQAISVLRSRLYQAELDRVHNERAAQRKTLVSTGDRSAKIRTYNYPQGRITDHRINKTMYNLSSFMNGDIQELIDALRMAENAEKLKGQEA